MGGFENITFSNSVIYNDDVPLNARAVAGIAIEMVDGGLVTGVVISNVRMQRVRTPIFIRLGNRGNGQRVLTPGKLRGVMIDNVHATGAILTSSITGLPGHDLEDISLTIRLLSGGGNEEGSLWNERFSHYSAQPRCCCLSRKQASSPHTNYRTIRSRWSLMLRATL